MFEPGPVNGLTRWPQMGIDSAQRLHYVTPFNSIRLDDQNYSGRVLHSEWDGQRWGNLQVLPGPGGEFADLSIGLGNQLHVVYHNVSNQDIWYTTRTVDAPRLIPPQLPERSSPQEDPALGEPAQTLASSSTLTPTFLPSGSRGGELVQVHERTWSDDDYPSTRVLPLISIVLVGVISSLLIVVTVLVGSRLGRRRQ